MRALAHLQAMGVMMGNLARVALTEKNSRTLHNWGSKAPFESPSVVRDVPFLKKKTGKFCKDIISTALPGLESSVILDSTYRADNPQI